MKYLKLQQPYLFISVVGNILNEFCTHILILAFQLDSLCNCYTILRDLGTTEALFNQHVLPLWTKCDCNRVCQLVNACGEMMGIMCETSRTNEKVKFASQGTDSRTI